jgi:hypothetical protein
MAGLLDMFGVAQQGGGLLGQLGRGLRDNRGMVAGFGDPRAMIAGAQSDMYGQKMQQELMQSQLQAKATEAAAKRLGIEGVNDPRLLEIMLRQQNVAADNSLARERFDWERKNGGVNGLETFSTHPVEMEKDGNRMMVQVGNRGTVRPMEGYKPSSKPIIRDSGAYWSHIDPISGQEVGRTPKDLSGAAAARERGEAQGKMEAGAEGSRDAAGDALGIIKQIEGHPSRELSTGWSRKFMPTNTPSMQDFEDLVGQAKSGAFLTAVQQLKGLGAMSEYEAKSATAAINRMNTAGSEEGFMAAVRDYKSVVERAQAKAQGVLQGGGGQQGGGRMRFDANGNRL